MSVTGIPISQLIAAIRQVSLSGVIEALQAGADIEEADQHGQAGLPLRTACFTGKIEIVRELIEHGANVNAAGSDGPGMPLRLALRAKHADIVALLLASGAQVPPEVTLPEALPAVQPRVEVKLPEMPALEFSPAPLVSQPADFLPEMPALALPDDAGDGTANYVVDEEVDITANYGLDTNLLTMDLLRSNDAPPQGTGEKSPPSTEQGKTGFWKSGRRS